MPGQQRTKGEEKMIRIALALGGALAFGSPASAETSALSDQQIATALKRAECTVELADARKEMTLSPIDSKHRLAELPCWTAAYNTGSIFMAVPEGATEKARLLRFQTSENGKRFTQTYALTNANYEQKTRTLQMYHKSRGAGDCGAAGAWRWSGTEFKMTGFWYKDPCDGQEFGFGAARFDRWRIFPKRG
jgi:hypothetical protein